MSASTSAIPASSGSRFCPYCGNVSAPEYAFCARCGKALPPLAAPVDTNAQTIATSIAASVASPDEPEVGATVWDRPLTAEERSHFERVKRSPQVTIPRVLGSLFGIMPLFLLFMGLAGTSFPAETFVPVVLGTAVFALIAGGISFSFRMPASVALSASSVREARGVPEKGAVVRGRWVPVRLGDAELLVPASLAATVPEGQLTQVLYVHGPKGGRPPAPGYQGVWMLGMNDTPFTRGRSGYVRVSEDVASPSGGVLG